jgi:hypothetical protein
MVRAGGKVELQLAYPELKLIFVEGVGGLGTRGSAILARTHGKIVCNDHQVGGCSQAFRGVGIRPHQLDIVAKN